MQWMAYAAIWCAAVWVLVRLCETSRYTPAGREDAPPATGLADAWRRFMTPWK